MPLLGKSLYCFRLCSGHGCWLVCGTVDLVSLPHEHTGWLRCCSTISQRKYFHVVMISSARINPKYTSLSHRFLLQYKNDNNNFFQHQYRSQTLAEIIEMFDENITEFRYECAALLKTRQCRKLTKDERWKIIVLFYSFVIKGKMEKAQNPFMTMGDIFLAHRHKIRWKYMIWKLCLCSAVEVCKVITFLIANLSIWYYDRAFSGMLSYIFFRMLDIVKNYTEGILGFV